jgi:hypothetical protein
MASEIDIRQLRVFLLDLFGPKAVDEGRRRMTTAAQRGDREAATNWRRAIETLLQRRYV